MGFIDDFYAALDEALQNVQPAKLSKETHLSKCIISKIINRKTKNPKLKTIGHILDKLGYKLIRKND